VKYDQSVIDNTLDEAVMLYRQGKSEKGSYYATLAIAMMMRNSQQESFTVDFGYG